MLGRIFSGLLLVVLATGCSPSKPTPIEPKLDSVKSKSAAISQPMPAPDELTLYAIDGLVDEPNGMVSDDKYFRGYAILGKIEITDLVVRQNIVKAIEDGFNESGGPPAACFWPRHGVHVVTDGKAVDYVICYECMNAHIFMGDEQSYKTTAPTHQAVLTAPLTRAGIKLAPSIEEFRKSKRSTAIEGDIEK